MTRTRGIRPRKSVSKRTQSLVEGISGAKGKLRGERIRINRDKRYAEACLLKRETLTANLRVLASKIGKEKTIALIKEFGAGADHPDKIPNTHLSAVGRAVKYETSRNTGPKPTKIFYSRYGIRTEYAGTAEAKDPDYIATVGRDGEIKRETLPPVQESAADAHRPASAQAMTGQKFDRAKMTWVPCTESERQAMAGREVIEHPGYGGTSRDEVLAGVGGHVPESEWTPDWRGMQLEAQQRDARQRDIDSGEEYCVPWLRD